MHNRPAPYQHKVIPYHPDYVAAFGMIEIEWNQIEAALYRIFELFVGRRKGRGYLIFFTIQTHRARREITEALALNILASRPAMYQRFLRLMRRLKNAASKRNEVVHTPWRWVGGKPEHYYPLSKPMAVDMLKELRARAQTLAALELDLREFHYQLDPELVELRKLTRELTRESRPSRQGTRRP